MAKKTYMVTVKTETIYDEGSYSALVALFGKEYAISYSNREIKIFGTSASGYDRRPMWKIKSALKIVREFAETRINQQPPEWHKAHEETYSLKSGASAPINPNPNPNPEPKQ